MKPTLARKIFCVAALLCAAAWNANAVNMVTDSGFEASADGLGPHDFSVFWSTNDPARNAVGGDAAFAHSGTNYAFMGTAVGVGVVDQFVSGLVVGQSYNLSFWLANDITVGLPAGNFFQVFFNGAVVFSLTNQNAFGYTQFAISNLLYTGGSPLLQFVGHHENDFWRLDDISLEAVGVPEAFSTIWLALPAFGALGLVQFSRARARKSLAQI